MRKGERSLLLARNAQRALATNFTFKSAYLARSHYLSAIKNLEGRRRSATPTLPSLVPLLSAPRSPPTPPISQPLLHIYRREERILTVRVVSHRPLGFITDSAAANSRLPTVFFVPPPCMRVRFLSLSLFLLSRSLFFFLSASS